MWTGMLTYWPRDQFSTLPRQRGVEEEEEERQKEEKEPREEIPWYPLPERSRIPNEEGKKSKKKKRRRVLGNWNGEDHGEREKAPQRAGVSEDRRAQKKQTHGDEEEEEEEDMDERNQRRHR